MIRKIKKILYLIFFLSLYSGISIYSERICFAVDSKRCSAINLIVLPGKTFIDSYVQTKEFLTNYFLSGKVVKTGGISKDPIITKERFKNIEKGFTFFYEKGSRKDAGFLLLSRTNPENGFPSIELWNLNLQKKVHEYKFDLENISKKTQTVFGSTNIFTHPNILNDGTLLIGNVGDKGLLVKFDECGNFLKSVDLRSYYDKSGFPRSFHHSLEIDKNGNTYIPTKYPETKINNQDFPKDFDHDGFAILDSDLNIKNEIALLDIYEESGLIMDIFNKDPFAKDPFHLNDVQPFIRDDGSVVVLLSLRNQSTLIAYDIEKSKIIWKIDRATIFQHDVDITNSNNDFIDIGVFNNNIKRYPPYKEIGNSTNEYVTFRNLPTKVSDQIKFISNKEEHNKYKINRYDFSDLDDYLKPRTFKQGLADLNTLNNSLIFEETGHGRIFEIDLSSKQILWEFQNKSKKNSLLFQMSWSRFIPELNNISVLENKFKRCSS